jgi:non-canonical poly(A) RNA polymerase PAPD5/7
MKYTMGKTRAQIYGSAGEPEWEKEHGGPNKRAKLVGESDYLSLPEELIVKENSALPPWCTARVLAAKDSLHRLHEELVAFKALVTPSPSESATEQEVLVLVTRIAKSLWSGAQVKIFGSASTGLNLPCSDVDMVVLAETDDSQTAMLYALFDKLQSTELFSSLVCIDQARVPILKMKHCSGLDVDISVNQEGGVLATHLVKEYLAKYPEVKYLVLFLKAFLKQRALNETYSGGVGSFLLFCMAVASVQLHPAYSSPHPEEHFCLGHFLMHFLKIFGSTFDYESKGLSIIGSGRVFLKKARGWWESSAGFRLSVECPQNRFNDIGTSAYNIIAVRQAFNYAYMRLSIAGHQKTKSLLHSVLNVEDWLRSRDVSH